MKRLICGVLLCAMLCASAHLPARAEEARCVALTFDDGPSGRFTERLLDGLAERGVKATFFLCGYRIEQYPALAARIASEGHEVGSHGDKHRYFTDMSAREVCADLAAAAEKLQTAAGVAPTLLRPPGGLYDADVLRQSVCAALPIVLWSVDPRDWCCSDSDCVTRRVVENADDGDIILMHDMTDSSVDAALRAIDAMQKDGFRFVTVSELAAQKGVRLCGGTVYHRFSAAKNDSISAREAVTEPCTKWGLPPPRPRRAAFRRAQSGRRSSAASNRT